MRWWTGLLAVTVLLATLPVGSALGAAKAQKLTITLREMSFTPARVTLQAGTKTQITLLNKGKVKHEFMVYDTPAGKMDESEMHAWAEEHSYFKGVEVEVEGGGIAVEGEEIFEVEVGPGRSAELTFTPRRTGTFEMGCMVEGHYEQGMKGVVVVK
ncbi:MAG: cupredoxin domain-containing protein [Armatimonadota bacterium]|nr:cupredoxin domain-containing protein [Armatimonadota bacterium]MDR7450572.1 cupredoxin domain-containing protein [Armatimonadota bacterium]MDR7466295.1 cupredoxin domain-containing protein [Armatimonadota bacterium]MDR7493016.1 cupredoxin domain-containing protein [Armatimonadota bacterium]MDR7498227.1 cupredoxin domain-containing protein [Armatimonadota bacterium]